MITAICVSALPAGQTKKIDDLAVFAARHRRKRRPEPSKSRDGSPRGSYTEELGEGVSVAAGNSSLGVVTLAPTQPYHVSSIAARAAAEETLLHVAQFGAAQYVARDDWQRATCVLTLESASAQRVVVSWKAVAHNSEHDDESFDATAQPFVGASGKAIFEPGARSVAV